MDDFKQILDDIDNFHKNQERKKIEKLLCECIKTQVTLDSEDSRILDECHQELDNFKKSFIHNPKKFLPLFRHLPNYVLERKRVYKSILNVETKLRELVQQKVKNNPCEEQNVKLFFLMYFIINISSLIHSKPAEKSRTKPEADPDEIISSQEFCDLSFVDICGLQFYKTSNYVKICGYDVPPNTVIVVYNKQD